MEEISNAGYLPETTDQTVPQGSMTDDQLKDLLAELISSSASLNVRVWLDGVYTDIENTGTRREWMKGREVYFKVEGKVDSQNSLEEASHRTV
jgi:predicted metal-dependent peptidase